MLAPTSAFSWAVTEFAWTIGVALKSGSRGSMPCTYGDTFGLSRKSISLLKLPLHHATAPRRYP